MRSSTCQQETHQRERRIRLVALATSLVAVLSAGFGAYSWHQQRRVEASYREAQAHESESLASLSEQLLAQGDRMEAIQVAMAALPETSTSDDRPLVPAAQLALEHALQVYPSTSLWRSSYAVKDVTAAYALSPAGLHAFEGVDGTVRVRTLQDGTVVSEADPRKEIAAVTGNKVTGLTLRFCGERLVCSADGGLAVLDPATGALAWRASVDGFVATSDIATSPDATRMAIGASFGPAHVIGDERADVLIVRIINVRDGSVAQGFRLPLDAYAAHTDAVRLTFSPDGSTLAVANSGRLWTIGLATGDVNWTSLPDADARQLVWCDDALVCVCVSDAQPDPYTEPVQLSCYGPELYQRWIAPLDVEQAFDAHGLPLDTDTHVVGAYPAQGEDGEARTHLVVATGSTARYLDAATGEELGRQTTGAPIRASLLDDLLYLADQGGQVSAQQPDPAASTAEVTQLAVAAGSVASFGRVDGITYLAAYDEEAGTYRIYRLTPRSTVPKRTPLTSKYFHERMEATGIGTPNQLLVSASDTELAGLDANSLKRTWKRSFAWLGYEGSPCSFACGQQAVYVFETDRKAEGAQLISVISPANGKVADRIELGDGWEGISALREQESDDATLLVVRDLSSAGVIDATSHEELMRVTPASGQLVDAWLADGMLLVLAAPSYGGTTDAFECFSLADGSALEADIRSCAVRAGGAERLVSLDAACSLVAVSCADGRVRAFSAADGSLAWEGDEELPGLAWLCFAPDGSHLFAQDATGACLLLSAKDGRVVAASGATLPPIQDAWSDDAQPDRLFVRYRHEGRAGDTGLATVMLDPSCFGPASDTPCGIYYTPDGSKVLTYDAVADDAFACLPHYTLDDLLGLAHATIAGHELTDAERRLYHIERL